jgi:hypothetical protein
MKKSITEFTPAELVEKAQDNHVWLNGFDCIRPTDEFKILVADQILAMLEKTDMTDSMGISPMIILTINKS